LKNLWSDEEAKKFKSDLDLRVYTSNLLGRSDELVLHGGGNTSVKSMVEGEEILYVKEREWLGLGFDQGRRFFSCKDANTS